MYSKKFQISLIIPTLNNLSGIREFVEYYESVFSGTENYLELVIVDDGSNVENRMGALKYIQERDVKIPIKLLLLSRNCGQFIATRYGISNAEGSFLLTIDDDKVIPAFSIDALLEKCQQNELDFVVGTTINVLNPNLIRRIGTGLTAKVGRIVYGTSKSHVFGSTILFRSSSIQEIARKDTYVTKTGWFYHLTKNYENQVISLIDIGSNRDSNYNFRKLLKVFSYLIKLLIASVQVFFIRATMMLTIVFTTFTLVFSGHISKAPIGYTSLLLLLSFSIVLSLLILTQLILVSSKNMFVKESPVTMRIIQKSPR